MRLSAVTDSMQIRIAGADTLFFTRGPQRQQSIGLRNGGVLEAVAFLEYQYPALPAVAKMGPFSASKQSQSESGRYG